MTLNYIGIRILEYQNYYSKTNIKLVNTFFYFRRRRKAREERGKEEEKKKQKK